MKQTLAGAVRLAAQSLVAVVAGESSLTDPFADPSFAGGGTWGGGRTVAGVQVDAERALRHSAFFASVSIVANTFARAPLIPYLEVGDPARGRSDKRRAVDDPLWRIFRRRANRWQTPFAFQQMSVVHRMLAGNFIAEAVWNGAGELVELVPLAPGQVTILGDNDPGRPPAYHVVTPGGRERVLRRDEVLHVPHLSVTGKSGLSVLGAARDALGTALAAQDHSGRFFAQSLLQKFLFSHPKTLTPKGRAFIQEQIEEKKGPEGQGLALILPDDMKLLGISVNPRDAQLLEARTFGVLEIARFCNVFPQLLGETSAGMSFASVEQFFDAHVHMTMDAYFTPFEQEADFALIVDPRLSCEFLRQALMRADTRTRWSTYALALTHGVYTRNEVRQLENMPRLSGLDVPLRRLDTTAARGEAGDVQAAAAALGRLSGLEDGPGLGLAEARARRQAESGWRAWEGREADTARRRARARRVESDTGRRVNELAAAAAARLVRQEERFLSRCGEHVTAEAAREFYAAWAGRAARALAMPRAQIDVLAEARAREVLKAGAGAHGAGAPALRERLTQLALYGPLYPAQD